MNHVPEARQHALWLGVAVVATLALALGVTSGVAAPPANDAFAAAEPLEGESGSRQGTTVEATNEPGEPNHDGERSVWYRWTAPVTGRFLFETCNAAGVPPTQFDTILAVFEGATQSELRRIARSDDACDEQSRVSVEATGGTTYHVVVAGYDGSERGPFTLRWRRIVAPANDPFAQAQLLTGATGTVSGSTLGATLEPGEPSHGDESVASVWYTWTAPATVGLVFQTCGSSFDTLLAIYTGNALSGLRQIVQDDDGCGTSSRVRLDAQAGTTYRIAVAGFDESGDFRLVWMRRPANDDVEDARTIRGARGALSASNVGATREQNEPSRHRATVWYRWRATSPSSLAFSTCTASFDTVLFVYRLAGSRLVSVGANDDGCRGEGLGSLLVVHAQRGATYYVGVDGLSGASGTFRLVWGRPPPYAWCVVPDVRGLTLARARDRLTRANCAVGRVVQVGSTIVPRGRVISQFPTPSSTRRPFGTRVNLEVSRGRR